MSLNRKHIKQGYVLISWQNAVTQGSQEPNTGLGSCRPLVTFSPSRPLLPHCLLPTPTPPPTGVMVQYSLNAHGNLWKTTTRNNEDQPNIKMTVSCPTSFGTFPSTTPTAHAICYSLLQASAQVSTGDSSLRASVASLFHCSYYDQ